MRTLISSAAAAVLAAIVSTGAAQAQTTLRVGWCAKTVSSAAAPFAIATKLGWYAKEGIKVDVVPLPGSTDCVKLVATKELQASLPSAEPLAIIRPQGVKAKFFYTAYQGNIYGIAVPAESSVQSIKDLKGKKISTTAGTTAHVFLDNALRANGVDPKEVEVVNQRMSEAVTSFISGAVPAVALWVPFNIAVRDKVPGAKMLVDASAYYPQAAIVGGWVTTAQYQEKNPETLKGIIRGWASANDWFIGNSGAALGQLQSKHYQQVPLTDLKEQYGAQKMFTSAQWRAMYADGTVTKWLQQVTDFFVRFANIQNPVPAQQYFDTRPYLETIKG